MTVMTWNVAFLRTRFSHVLAYGFDPVGDRWVIVDPCARRLGIQIMDREHFDAWAKERVYGEEVWRLRAVDRLAPRFHGFFCVGAIKHLLGLRSGALLPSGLRRDIIRAGAKRVQTGCTSMPPRKTRAS